jgi:hypothetical protein
MCRFGEQLAYPLLRQGDLDRAAVLHQRQVRPEALAEIPIWSQLPAVTTKNVIPWDPEPLLTYTTVTTFARTLTTYLT